MPNLKFQAQIVTKIWSGSKIPIIDQVTHSRPSDLIFLSIVSDPGDQFSCQIWSF